MDKLPGMEESFHENKTRMFSQDPTSPSKPKIKRKKVTIIKKRH